MTATSEELRESLVAKLREAGVVRSQRVQDAFLAVPRELFLPEIAAAQGLGAIYRDEAIVTKRDERGIARSSSSQPAMMAEMLELLAAEPGHHVLEVGAGTGYNAALLAHLVGDVGRVTSIDIDAELARRARHCLTRAGCPAQVAVGDGRAGHAAAAPYDRIIVTASAETIPRAWLEQLSEGGRVELPLRLDPDGAAVQVIPVLERRGGVLRSVALTWGSFMSLHGGDGGARTLPPTLTATHAVDDQHTALSYLSGPGLGHLSTAAARTLLAATLGEPRPPLRTGLTDLSGARPPMLLIHLLLGLPADRRVSLRSENRLGIGLVDARRPSLAVVSLRSPWTRARGHRGDRARWRLDVYGGDSAAGELIGLLERWEAVRREQRTRLELIAEGPTDPLQLRFDWCHPL